MQWTTERRERQERSVASAEAEPEEPAGDRLRGEAPAQVEQQMFRV